MTLRMFTIFLFVFFYFVNIKCWKLKRKKPEKNEEAEEEIDAAVFCRNRSRLIKLEKSDDFYVVDVVVNSSILMQCKFCEEKDNGLPKTWSRQRHIFTGNITEVDLSMDNNVSVSKTFVTKTHSLVIRNVQESDMGLYFCKAPYVDNLEKSFNYLVDLISHVQDDVQGGKLTDWKNYSEIYFTPIADKLLALKTVEGSSTINLTIFTDWAEWSECDSCFRTQGIRSRVGRCRLKPVCENPENCFYQQHDENYTFFSDKFNTDTSSDSHEVADPTEVKEDIFIFSIALSCQSLLLNSLFPEIYNLTQNIPDFVLSENCTGVCKGKSRKKGPRYKRSIILAKGAHLTLICPDSTLDSQVRWEHNKVRLYPNEGLDYVPGSIEPRIYVDSFNTLYLFDVTEKESGNFTCFVNGVRMQEISVAVLTRSLFFTKEFRRHLGYLGIVFLLCFFAYISGVIVVCIKKQAENRKFRRFKNVEEVTSEETETLLN